jgi:4-amino-4-deoxy-L-arabinose transferase-like glycosyltransferase
MSLILRASQIKDELPALLGKSWMQYVWLLMITLFAAALRFYRLGEWSFWIDELYTINHAMAHFSSWELIRDHIPPYRNWVPVSVILAAQALKLWGVSEWSARLASVIIGVLSIPILFFPTRKIFGTGVALFAALLLAVSPWHIFWSQNARFYTSLLLLYTLALFVFYHILERDQLGYFVLFYGLLYLAFSERLFAFFVFPVIGVYIVALWLLKFEKPKGLTFRNMVLLVVPVFLGSVIELYSRITSGESRFFADFDWFFLYRNDDPIRLLGNVSFNIGIPLIVLALFSGLFLIRRKHRAGLLMTANAVVPLAMLVAANPFIFTKDRYMFMVLFSWAVLAAVGIQAMFSQLTGQHKWFAVGVLTLLLLDAGGDALLYYRINHGNRAEWKAAFQMIQEQSQPDDVVVTYWPEFRPFYLERDFMQYEEIDVPTLLGSEERYWFVMDAETIWANPEVKAFVEKNARLIDVRYLRTPDDFFLRIYLFDPSHDLSQSHNRTSQ